MEIQERYVAFARSADPSSGIEVRVNFGLSAGREATPAEIDELGRRALVEFERLTIVSERRYEISKDVEASVHQVCVTVPADGVPDDVIEAARLEGKLVSVAETWALACGADRSAVVP
jgi:hypothetical protein